MSVSEQITRIQNNRNTIRIKLAELGLGDGTEKLEVCAEKISGIANKGTVAAQVKEGEAYTIEAGYYKGGTVTGVSGGGNYKLEKGREVTPIKEDQTITVTPGSGFYGLDSVLVKAIPAQYQDVTDVNVPAEYVLSPYTFVDKEGTVTAGTMPNIGAAAGTIDGMKETSYTIPKGYHDGNGTVTLTNSIELALAEI